ncbi:MAG: hypothetical protein HZY74_04745 [Brevundimonas sp.]|nr:MAG: hypothetical protein HZY74_04745 [Brevundimonas sp.]
MFRALCLGIAAALALAASAQAEVVERSANRFVLRYQAPVDATAHDLRMGLQALPVWWDSAHTYSGDAANLSLDLSAGGCWCERLANGTDFDHARTVQVDEDGALFAAPFGPLRGRTERADLAVSWPLVGEYRQLTWDFVIEGEGIGAMADVVDGVMGAGFARFVTHMGGAVPAS